MENMLSCHLGLKVSLTSNPGLDQLQKILSLMGTPQPALVQKMQSADVQAGPRRTLTHLCKALGDLSLLSRGVGNEGGRDSPHPVTPTSQSESHFAPHLASDLHPLQHSPI